ncbi:MAG: fatty acid desaturase [Holophaga sp.]|nr:fatty acid desaturase [Holophaga sp.]
MAILLMNLGVISLILMVDFSHYHGAIWIVSILVLSSRFKALNNIVHECAHYSFHHNPNFNRSIGGIVCGLLGQDYSVYKAEHMSHHGFLGDYDRDLDFQTIRSFSPHLPQQFNKILKNILSIKFLSSYAPKRFGRTRQSLLGNLAIWAIMVYLLIHGLMVNWVIFLVAYFIGFPLMKYLTDLVDHGGIYANPIKINQTRNFILKSKLIKWLLFPRNDCYHLIHHLYPALPVKVFQEAHQALLEDPSYRQLTHHARGIRLLPK